MRQKQGALDFTAAFRQAVDAYKLQHPDIQSQMATFEDISGGGSGLLNALTTSTSTLLAHSFFSP